MTWQWITLEGGRSVYRDVRRTERQRSDLPAPRLIRDQMDALRNPTNGRTYDSKSAFREATKANGGQEIGDQRSDARPAEDTSYRDDVGQAIRQLKDGYRPSRAATASEAGWIDPVP